MYNISQLLSLNISIPAFYRLCERSHEKTTGILTCHPKLIALYKRLHKKDVQSHFKLDAFEVPMLVPPRPWTSVTEGGYLALSCEQEYNIRELYNIFSSNNCSLSYVTLINIVCCFVHFLSLTPKYILDRSILKDKWYWMCWILFCCTMVTICNWVSQRQASFFRITKQQMMLIRVTRTTSNCCWKKWIEYEYSWILCSCSQESAK